MVERAPETVYKSIVDSSPRWEHFTHRPGDVFVCTPPKVGTTWVQNIVRSLMSGEAEPEGSLSEICPWIDARFEPIDEVVARLDAQTHRRGIKSHTPADGIPLWATGHYIAVYRDGRDAFMSWVNHITNMNMDRMSMLIEEAIADGVDFSGGPPPTDDLHEIYARWINDAVLFHHLDTWWPLRAEPNVTIVHYNDLLADLDGEMRRLGERLDIKVDDQAWRRVVERCTFEEMKQASIADQRLAEVFVGGGATFFHKGTNGRWRDTLTDDELTAYDALTAARLEPDLAQWLEHGSLSVGCRPEDI